MDARARVREFLGGGAVDRPPVLAFALDLAARVASATRAELLADPHLLSLGLRDAVRLCSLDAAVLALRAAELPELAAGAPPTGIAHLAVCAEAVSRLRVLLGDSAAITVLLPGPLTLLGQAGRQASPELLEDTGMRLLNAVTIFGPHQLDTMGVWEEAPTADAACLRKPLAPLWNAASYYSVPSLFAARSGSPGAAAIGARAVTVWGGATPRALVAAGATRIGLPLLPPPAPQPLQLPRNSFLITAGELPAEADTGWLRTVTAAASFAPDRLRARLGRSASRR
jgi:hypothetical protein